MSNETKKTTVAKHEAPAGFEKVLVDMPSFKPEPFSEREGPGSTVQMYNGRPLAGVILGARNFGAMRDADGAPMHNDDGEVNDMIALLVQVEADVDVIGRDKKPLVAKAGDQILWFVTTKVRQAIMGALRLDSSSKEEANQRLLLAMNGAYSLRFWCLPLKQEPHPTNPKFKIWSYDFRLAPEPIKRVGSAGLSQFFAHAAGHVALPAAPGGPTGTVLPATNGARA